MLSISLNLLIPATVITTCFIYVIFNFFIALRKRFSIKVNCWFCNSNTRVPYNNQNSFVCPNCQQFNGFSDDGDYNQDIPEQHYSRLNTSNTLYCQKTNQRLPASNGLCDACNRNQEMKVIQLANFKPRCDTKYDEEIEEYRQKLEDSYQLCQECQRHLNKTLNRVKTKLIGSKISKIISKGVQAVTGEKSEEDKKILSKFAMIVILVLSFVNFARDLEVNLDFLAEMIRTKTLVNFYHHLVALRLTIADLFGLNWLKEMDLSKFLEADKIAVTAVIMNFSIILSQPRIRFHILASLLLWSVKMALSEVEIDENYLLALKRLISGVILIVSIHMIVKSGRKVEPSLDQNSTSFRKIHSEVYDDSENECDMSDSMSNFSSKYSPESSIFNRSIIKPATTFSNGKSLHNQSILTKTLTPSLANFDARSVRSSKFSNFDNRSNFDNLSNFDSISNANNASNKNRISNKNSVCNNFSNFDNLSNFDSISNVNNVSNKNRISNRNHVSNNFNNISNFSNKTNISNKNNLNNSEININNPDNNNFDNFSNRSFSIRQEVSAADRKQVQKDITKLNISGSLLGSTSTLKDFSLNKTLNPFSLENSRCGSPTPSLASVFSGSYRAQAISPPRLEPTYVGEASWVAGGYWSSPQKRCLDLHKTAEMSRSSSQSSGLGTIDSDKNSRENSVGRDEFSIFSEPVRRRNLFEKPMDSRSLFGQSFGQPRNNFFLNSTSQQNAGNSFRQYRESNATYFK